MKKRWGRKVSDLSYSSFVLKLEQVANKYNTIIQKIDRWYPSSKKCGCGVINEDLKLADRVWTCKSCNAVNDRDLLAGNNILSEGIRLYRTKYKTEIISAIQVESKNPTYFNSWSMSKQTKKHDKIIRFIHEMFSQNRKERYK